MPGRISSGNYRASFIVIPDIGGLGDRICQSKNSQVPPEYTLLWREARDYIAIVRIPDQGHPFLQQLDLQVPIEINRESARLDFKNARYVSGESFREDYISRQDRKHALDKLAEESANKCHSAVQQLRNQRIPQEIKPSRFTLFFKIEKYLANGFRPGRICGQGQARRRGRGGHDSCY